MQDHQNLGKYLVIIGLITVTIGLLFLGADRFSLIKYIGKLPGDISIEKPGFRFYFPLATSLILSLILSFVFWLIRNFK